MDITLSELKGLLSEMLPAVQNSCPFRPGEKWLFRLVTYHIIGEVVSAEGGFICIGNASWVADSGRFGEALTTGSLSEVEYFGGEMMINQSAIVDAWPWRHDLPSETL